MLLLVAAVTGCAHRTGPGTDVRDGQRTPERYEFARVLMGSRCRIVLFAPDEAHAARAAGAAFDRIAALDGVLSDYRADSEAAILVGSPSGVWRPVSEDLGAVLHLSRRVFEASDGAFDPTVGPFTRLWREARRTGEMTSDGALADARERVGFGLIEFGGDGRVRLRKSGMVLDFGGIGKGYAADAGIGVLGEHGCPAALVDFGGDIVAGDAPPGSPEGWRVDVRDGLARTRTLYLARRAVATSGDLEQYVVIGGERFAHIVDPLTGLGLTRRTAATVIADSGALADALASAACVLGPEGAARLEGRFEGVRIECVTAE